MTLQVARPGLYRAGVHYTVLDEMVRELQVEPTPESQGLWVANTVQPVWELGKRYGLPDVRSGALDVNGQDAFLPGPLEGRRWLVVAVHKPVTTGNSEVLVRPKSSTDTTMVLSPTDTIALNINLPYPGFPVEHQSPFDGGQLGLSNSSDAGDTARTLRIMFYDLEC